MRKKRKCNNKGLSLVEMIIVIAVMAILASIITPNVMRFIEKSRRQLDAQNAIVLERTLLNALNMGEVDFVVQNKENTSGVWVLVTNGKYPINYTKNGYVSNSTRGKGQGMKTICGANQNVFIYGQSQATVAWNVNNAAVRQLLLDYGFDMDSLKVHANSSSSGWDWYMVEISFSKDGNYTSAVYSGFATDDSDYTKYVNEKTGARKKTTNIEKYLGE